MWLLIQALNSTRKYKDYVYGNVSTGVLEKIKKQYLVSKDKAEKWYDVSRHI